MQKIIVQAEINAPVKKVWERYTKPEHIMRWNSASEDWHTPRAENDLRVGGKFLSRMEAKDGSAGFDFSGIYDEVEKNKLISYTMDDGRKAEIIFTKHNDKTHVKVTFDPENENPTEMQRSGWQAILNNFKKYVEAKESQKIVPHLWFDKEAVEAAEFYTSVFPGSKITHKSMIKDTPSGDCDIVGFRIMDFDFMSISAGPYFKINPSISFFVNFDPSYDKNAKNNIDVVWKKLSEDGKILMEIGEYPWSKRYGWVQDKFGVSWQLILTNPEGEERPKIVPSLLFVNEKCGKAEEAVKFYLSVFKNSKIGNMMHYGPGQEPNKEGTVMFSDFMLEKVWFSAMDGGGEHKFDFNEGISFIINCEDQKEIDHYWKKLSHFPESEQCGWLKDKFGVSWQIVPTILNDLLSKDKSGKVTKAMLGMKKMDIKKLEEAHGK